MNLKKPKILLIFIFFVSIFIVLFFSRNKTITVQYNSGIMQPTLSSGPVKIRLMDRSVNIYNRGTIVYYSLTETDEYGRNPGNYIGRIIGLSGEKVRMEEDQIFINEEPLQENYTSQKANISQNFSEITVPEGAYLIMGDLRSIVPVPKILVHQENILGIIQK